MMTTEMEPDTLQGNCPVCGTALPAGVAVAACPRCLLQGGLATQTVVTPGTIGRRLKGMPQPGDQFGSYRILQFLGQGGMGVVFEAEDMENGRRIALKLLQDSLDSIEARARFAREGQLAASLNHPNSVYVFGADEVGGTPVIAMELMAGGTLRDRITSEGPMAPAIAVDAILQIIAGLDAAAQAGLLHRDVKPSNCFIDSDGTMKIGDFGLSIDTNVRADLNALAGEGVMGTPAFSSPEQLRGERLNVSSDIYAVGVTLYYLLTGRLPFENENAAALLASVLETKPEPPTKYQAKISTGLNRVVLRCLEKSPANRPATYADLRAALQPFASSALAVAPLGARFVAGAVDIVFIASVAFVLANFKTNSGWKPTVIFYSIVIGYFTLLEGWVGATPGKALRRLRILTATGHKPSLSQAALRSLIFVGIALGGSDLSTVILGQDGPVDLIGGAITFVLLGLLFCTARLANGYAAFHEMCSGTRTFVRTNQRERVTELVAEQSPITTTGNALIGPYHVLARLAEGFWLAYDARLLRKVWIHQHSSGMPDVPAALRNISRPTHLRWLNSHRDETMAWDAYEAPAGQAFLSLIATPQSWTRVRFWLFDLTREWIAARGDQTLPESICLSQIWITEDGRAKLLDFSSPGMAASQPIPRNLFLLRFAAAALMGNVTATTVQKPIPRHAQHYLALLVRGEGDPNLLRSLLAKPAEVTRARRLTLAVCSVWFPFFMMCAAMVFYPNNDVGLLRHRLGALELLWTYGWMIVMVPGLLAALIARGGAILRGLDLAVVRKDGKPASRLRILWRTTVAYIPFLILPPLARLFGLHARVEWVMYALLGLNAALMFASALCPDRSWQDRLAGTTLVSL